MPYATRRLEQNGAHDSPCFPAKPPPEDSSKAHPSKGSSGIDFMSQGQAPLGRTPPNLRNPAPPGNHLLRNTRHSRNVLRLPAQALHGTELWTAARAVGTTTRPQKTLPSTLNWGSANFCKGQESKYFRLCRQHSSNIVVLHSAITMHTPPQPV